MVLLRQLEKGGVNMDELREYEDLLNELLKGVEVASDEELSSIKEEYQADEEY